MYVSTIYNPLDDLDLRATHAYSHFCPQNWTGDAEIGWRPTPEKNIETMPCWGKQIAQRIASWTWDVTHERALSPADLFGGKAPVGALIGLLERIR